MAVPGTLAIIGFGAFGRFMVPHLRDRFNIIVHDRADIREEASNLGVEAATLEQAASAEIVVFAVPVQSLERVLTRAAPSIRHDAIVLDVCSVKLTPIDLMLRLLPSSCSVVGLHPLFGPQSGKDGIAGLPLALCPARASEDVIDQVRSFLSSDLSLRVIETSADEHDRQMAYVQGLTHFVSRAVGSLSLPQTPMATRAYDRFLAMKADLQNDSLELFLTIERFNPYAAEIRRSLTTAMATLERQIDGP